MPFKTYIRIKVRIPYTIDSAKAKALVGYFETKVEAADVDELLKSIATYKLDQGLWHNEVLAMSTELQNAGRVRLYFRRIEHRINDGFRVIKFHMRTVEQFGDDILEWLKLLVMVPGIHYVPEPGSMSLDEALKQQPIRYTKNISFS